MLGKRHFNKPSMSLNEYRNGKWRIYWLIWSLFFPPKACRKKGKPDFIARKFTSRLERASPRVPYKQILLRRQWL